MKLDEQRKDREERKEEDRFAALASFAFPIVLIALFLALHLPHLPKSLEDIDSINFALGLRQFDVAHHQPHPPGYPVYIALGKAVRAAVPDEARALGLLSVCGGALGAIAIAALFRRLEPVTSAWAPATALAVASPLYWFTAARPLTDVPGLCTAVAVQALTLYASSARALGFATFCAGLAAGLRSQVAWLTVPLLIARGLGTGALGIRGLRRSFVPAAFFILGVLVWAIPLVAMTGGPRSYWQALFDQGAEDLGNIQMLWTRHGVRDVVDALYFAFVAPWATWLLASTVLASAALGIVWLWLHARMALLTIVVAFGPYLLFDVLFQETFTSRYALPLVVPMAFLAVAGLRWAPRAALWLLVLPLVLVSAYVGNVSVAAYSRQKAPAFRLLDDMKRASDATGVRPVLAPDRRESFDMRRPLAWAGAAAPPFVRQLTSPPQHEWLETVRYWNDGGRDPVWFLVDPKRAAIDLVQHPSPFEYRWPLPYPVLMSGVRPNDADWYPVDRPEWYVGEGWALTPEAAGVAAFDRRGLASSPIEGWIRRHANGGMMMIGGRNIDPSRTSTLTVTVDVGPDDRWPLVDDVIGPGPFLRFATVPAALDVGNERDYARLSVAAPAGNAIAVEQFDAGRLVFGYGDGWHEQEFNPSTGVRWRWLSERGEIRVASAGLGGQLQLRIEGESPLKYFSRGSRLRIRSGDQVVFDQVLSSDFAVTARVPANNGPIVLETDQTYVPADRGWRRTADRRHLGLRIFRVQLRPVD